MKVLPFGNYKLQVLWSELKEELVWILDSILAPKISSEIYRKYRVYPKYCDRKS